MVDNFVRLANARHLPRTLALRVLMLALPCLGIGLRSDDYVIATVVRDHPLDGFASLPGGHATAEMRERGILSWSVSHAIEDVEKGTLQRPRNFWTDPLAQTPPYFRRGASRRPPPVNCAPIQYRCEAGAQRQTADLRACFRFIFFRGRSGTRVAVLSSL